MTKTIETGTSRSPLAVARAVCAAVRQAADEGTETKLSVDGRQVAAIVPLDSQRHNGPVYVLLYSHRHGDDISVYASYDLARAGLAGICREWWNDARAGDDSFPASPDGLSDDEVIARYFNAMDSTESWEITEAAVHGAE
jgi:hypothetical protein